MTTPRGIRNHNPGNIDLNVSNDWQGQLGYELGVTKPRFARFDTPQNGIRALAKLLINYRGKTGEPGVAQQGIDTVRETINRWAPPVENDTGSYIAAVAKAAGVAPEQHIEIKDPPTLLRIVRAIIAHENAGYAYPESVLQAGVSRALE